MATETQTVPAAIESLSPPLPPPPLTAMDLPAVALTAATSCLCPNCGAHVDVTRLEEPHEQQRQQDQAVALEQAQKRIHDLEAQVRLLNDKAAAAVDRSADYEDELARLRQQVATPSSETTTMTRASSASRETLTATPTQQPPPQPQPQQSRSSLLAAGAASRLSALLSPRSARSTPNLKAAATVTAMPVVEPRTPATPGTPGSTTTDTAYTHSSASSYSSTSASSPPPPMPLLSRRMNLLPNMMPSYVKELPPSPAESTAALLEALAREQMLRRQAESRLQDTSREIEELSVSLFTQANEMVAEERRQRARLERRVAVLEQRDTEKRTRLARLEQAMARIERIRTLLGEMAPPAPDKTAHTVETASGRMPVTA